MRVRRSVIAVVALTVLGAVAGGARTAAAAEPITEVLRVDGWTRPECDEIGVELILESLDGVEEVRVTFETGRTEVTYDPERVTRRAMPERDPAGAELRISSAEKGKRDMRKMMRITKLLAAVQERHLEPRRFARQARSLLRR